MSTIKYSALALGVLAALCSIDAQALGNGAPAGDAASAAAAGSTAMSTTDRKFVHDAALGGMEEVALGHLAQQKASADVVKQFGAKMVEDHTKAGDQLKQLADSKNVSVPTALDKSHQKEVDKFGKLSGADFDKKYTSYMVSDHKKDVSDYKKEAKSARDGDLKSFAGQTLPILQEHLKMAQSANDAAKAEK